MVTGRRGPGLAKSREPALISATHGARVRASDVRWRALMETADVISEGAARREAVGSAWFGSTSMILSIPQASEEERTFLAAVADRDVHVRLRVLRIALREATLRAPAPLGRSQCEIRVQSDERGVRIDVDVQAPLIEGPAVARPTRP
jgi:hypothetical protein